jgi:PKHD-type hydroxylase
MNDDPKYTSLLNERFITDKWGNRELIETYTFTNSFTDEEIDYINAFCQQLPPEPDSGSVGTGEGEFAQNKSIRSSVIRWVPIVEETQFIYDRIYEMVKEANEELWGFDLSGFVENAQYTEYYGSDDGKYDWHLDIGYDTDFRKISITIQLSDEDEYEGGELEFLRGPMPLSAPKEKGVASLFPSYILHRVNNVTSGVRRSIVLWVTGPSFR